VLLVTAIAMHCAVILICCHSVRQQEYVCDGCYCNFNALLCDIDLLPFWTAGGLRLFACYCYCNALRCDIVVLPFWTAAGIRLCFLLLQL